ncbi:TauD/TfdA family dioxygenase [Spirillospora sp. NPDC047279]|uniref:TauD/TfdA dioxygenase family protein n=1 Tax=Spirillospora sp. NPDC047279 TaxID=3155478 RepID=UPI0033CB7459
MLTATSVLEISQVSGRIGAVVSGIELSGDLADETVDEIRLALLRHKVVFFRGQYHLDAREQAAFARRFGALIDPDTEIPALDAWHTDATFLDRPPRISVQRALEVPGHGGDTVWANTVTAYEDLPIELRDLADRLWFLHSATRGALETRHPLVRVHPETGERAILLGGFATSVVGLTQRADSEALIKLFQEYVTRLENTVRWRWAAGDVAIWDNRATQHRVINDFGDRPRRLHSTTVAGDVPVAVA